MINDKYKILFTKFNITNLMLALASHAIILSSILVCYSISNLNSQDFSIIKINSDSLPIIKANLFLFDKNNKPSTVVDVKDFNILENGLPRLIKSITCSPLTNQVKLSSVITIDISGTMAGGKLDIAKTAARKWIELLDSSSECAITSFDDFSFLNQDFTNDKNKLYNSVNKLNASGGTNYNAALLSNPTGALSIAETGKYKRVIIFLTDGLDQANEAEIVRKAQSINASIFCITVNMKTPDLLKNISRATDGTFFEDVITPDDALEAYRDILYLSYGYKPCSIEWISSSCDIDRNLVIKYMPKNIEKTLKYSISADQLPFLSFNEANSIEFGSVPLYNPISKDILITAINDSIQINSIGSSNPSFSAIFENLSTPFTLKKDSTIKCSIIYNPSDSVYRVEKIDISSNACYGSVIFVSGGYFEKSQNSLKVVFPNGFNQLIAGSDTTVTWTGLMPTDTVQLEYSVDEGKNWIVITSKASGNKYNWTVPHTKSDLCRFRVINIKSGNTKKLNVLPGENTFLLTAAWSPDSKKIATGDNIGVLKIWDAGSQKLIHKLQTKLSQISSIDWSMDTKKIICAGNERMIFIFDSSGKQVDSIYNFNSIVSSCGFSPDNKFIASGDNYGRLCINSYPDLGLFTNLVPHTSAINQVKWSSDSKYIYTASSDKSISKFQFPDINSNLGFSNQVLSVSVSPDNKLIASCGWNKQISISDSSLKTNIKSIQSTANINYSCAFSPDGKYLATGDDLKRLILWNTSDWSQVYSFPGHKDGLSFVCWSPDSLYVLSTSFDGSAEYWSPKDIPLNVPLIQSDISDNNWSIVEESIEMKNIDFGQVVVNTKRDSLIKGVLRNIGSVNVGIDSVNISGTDKDEFQIVSDLKAISVAALGQVDFELAYKPGLIHKSIAVLNIFSKTNVFKSNLNGEGKDQAIELVTKMIDFGKVIIGESSSTQTIILKNNSNNDINFESVYLHGPDTKQFILLSDTGKFTLRANGEIKEFKIIFEPSDTGRTNSSIKFYFNYNGSPATALIFGEGIIDGLIVKPTLEFPISLCGNQLIPDSLELMNKGNNSIQIDSISIEDSENNFSIINNIPKLIISPKSSKFIKILFGPQSYGIKSAKLKLFYNISDGIQRQKLVNLIGETEKSGFYLSTEKIDFGEVITDSRSDATFTIINIGTRPLSFNFPIKLQYFTITNIIPQNITENGGSATVYVKLTSNTPGIFNEKYIFSDLCNNLDSIEFKGTLRNRQAYLQIPMEMTFNSIFCNETHSDSSIKLFNIGKDKLIIDSVFIDGINANEFSYEKILYQGIESNNFYLLKLNFIPNSLGEKSAFLKIKSNAYNATDSFNIIKILGRKFSNDYSFSALNIDFKEIVTDSIKYDTITFYNKSKFDYSVKFSSGNYFKVRNISPEIVKANDSTKIIISCFSTKEGIFSEFIDFIDTCGMKIRINCKVNFYYPKSLELWTGGSYCGDQGDVIEIPVYIKNLTNIESKQYPKIYGNLSFHSSFLQPINGTDLGYIDKANRIIPFEFQSKSDTINQQFKFTFSVLKNGRDTCDLVFDSLISDNWKIKIRSINGKFYSYCDKYRIIDEKDVFRLYQNYPNPCQNFTLFEYEILKPSEIWFELYDLNGNKITTLDLGKKSTGIYRIPYFSSRLSSGIYFFILKNDSKKITGKMEVLR
ncbi:MAG: choice-of-anchor D domain-containing protein [Candidatus Kapabacteria bacterium]|nr:choice-of-anchor D domain-containing protein [Candidatus Kapabacteria bacterium]